MTDTTLDISLYAKPAGDGTLGMDLAVEGVACGACINRIENAMKKLPGVTEARLNFTNRRLHVTWNDGALDPARIIQPLWRFSGHLEDGRAFEILIQAASGEYVNDK